MVSEARKLKRREHAKRRRERLANKEDTLKLRSGVRHASDIARVMRKYSALKEQGLLTECAGCNLDIIIVPDENNCISYCTECNRELCELCVNNSRCSLCNLSKVELIPCPRAVPMEGLLLPCVNFDRATRDHNKGCRRAIPAREYYTHVEACSVNIAEQNNPMGAVQPPPEIPVEQVAALSSGGEENWNNDNDPPAPARNMYDAINNGIRNPALDIAVPSWAVSIVYGSRSARRNQKKKRKRMRQAIRLS